MASIGYARWARNVDIDLMIRCDGFKLTWIIQSSLCVFITGQLMAMSVIIKHRQEVVHSPDPYNRLLMFAEHRHENTKKNHMIPWTGSNESLSYGNIAWYI